MTHLRFWSKIDFVWAIASQTIDDRQSEVQRDALTFGCLRGYSFNDFCSLLDDVFEHHELIKNRGDLCLFSHKYASWLILKGVLQLVRSSRQRVRQVLDSSPAIFQPLFKRSL